MKQMYTALANSPITYLANDINASDTTINVIDGSSLPDAPNILVIGDGTINETIIYTIKNGNELSGVTRGVEGTNKAWQTGIIVSRLYTAYDHNALIENIDSKVDKVIGKQLSTEDYTTENKTKLESLENYVHPNTHPATMIETDSTHRFVTDAEKTSWTNGINIPTVTTTQNGLMLATDKVKLDVNNNDVNFQILSANLTLTATSAQYQFLQCNNGYSNRTVYLPNTAPVGKKFYIKNVYYACGGSYYYYSIIIKNSSNTELFRLAFGGNYIGFIFDGTNWIPDYSDSIIIGKGANNAYLDSYGQIVIGNEAVAYSRSTAIGTFCRDVGSGYGTGVGFSASMGASGTSIGYNANSYDYGTALGAKTNTNSKNNAIAKGYYSICQRWNEEWKCSDGSSTNKCGYGQNTWYAETTNATQTEIFLGGTTNQRFTILASSINNFTIQVAAFDLTNNIAKSWKVEGAIKKNATTTSLVGNLVKTIFAEDTGAETWDVIVSADTTNNALKIEVVGEASKTIRWNASSLYSEARF